MRPFFIKIASHISSPKQILLMLGVCIFIFVLVHLLLAKPLSHTHSHLLKIKKSAELGQGQKFLSSKTFSSKETDVPNIVFNHSFVPDGEGIWISKRKIQVMTAHYDINNPDNTLARIMIPSLLQHSVDRDFVCCIGSTSNPDEVHEVFSTLEYIDLRYVADFQSAVFSCPLPQSGKHLDFVAFATETCDQNMTRPLKIHYPKRRTFEYAVCTKVAYGHLEPSHLVEWFEFMREMGVSKVVTFYNNLELASKKVFDYYVEAGLMELIPYYPQNKINKLTKENATKDQSRHWKTLVVRDCQYRLGGYDFILTIDFDELPVPQRPYGTLNWVFQELALQNPNAVAFNMTPILLPPSWRHPEKVEPLYHWGFDTGTTIGRYCIKWVYRPQRTWVANTHEIYPRDPFVIGSASQDLVHFIHFRECKAGWTGVDCETLQPTIKDEHSLKRFEGRVIRRLKALPLDRLVPDKDYVRKIKTSRKKDGDR